MNGRLSYFIKANRLILKGGYQKQFRGFF
jgi:hypothetical protein